MVQHFQLIRAIVAVAVMGVLLIGRKHAGPIIKDQGLLGYALRRASSPVVKRGFKVNLLSCKRGVDSIVTISFMMIPVNKNNLVERKESMKIRQEASRYAMLVLGAAILAFGLYNVHSQSHITEGGVLGMTLLLEHWLGVSPAISEVGPGWDLLRAGPSLSGKAFLPHALAATGCFALFYALNEHVGPVLPNLGGMPLVAAAVGRRLCGRGRGTGGTRGWRGRRRRCAGAGHLQKAGMEASMAYLATDLTVLLLSLSYIRRSRSRVRWLP